MRIGCYPIRSSGLLLENGRYYDTGDINDPSAPHPRSVWRNVLAKAGEDARSWGINYQAIREEAVKARNGKTQTFFDVTVFDFGGPVRPPEPPGAGVSVSFDATDVGAHLSFNPWAGDEDLTGTGVEGISDPRAQRLEYESHAVPLRRIAEDASAGVAKGDWLNVLCKALRFVSSRKGPVIDAETDASEAMRKKLATCVVTCQESSHQSVHTFVVSLLIIAKLPSTRRAPRASLCAPLARG